MSGWRQRLLALKAEVIALYLAARHPGTPWYAKILVACVAAYALSPIDLIPDFIPLIGYLDDALLLPLGIALARWMIPPSVMEECRSRAALMTFDERPTSRTAAVAIVTMWFGAATAAALSLWWHLG